jgi:TetR/AcrR family transcriptional repressor of nem operon
MTGTAATLSKGERTRRRIIGHATQLIYDKGYGKTTIEDVMEAAGVTKGSFYFHFSSKEELGYAVIDNASSLILGSIKGVFDQQNLAPIQRLELMLRGVQGMVEEAECTRGCILGNLALEMSNVHDGFRSKLAEVFRGWSSLIAGVLEAMKESGELPQDFDSAAYAYFMVSALEGGIIMSKVSLDPSPMRNCIDLIFRQLESKITACDRGSE